MYRTLNKKDVIKMFESVSAEMTAHADELCQMDARLGDGDLGLTMKKGFEALPQLIGDVEGADIGKCLMTAGMKMASVVPSTMGTLMASGVMQAGKALKGKETLEPADLAAFFKAYAEGIAKRGKCSRGQRTVLDGIGAASDEAEDAISKDHDISFEELAKAALCGAEKGVEATKDMVPVFGKAAVHREASKGVPDQGAMAVMYVVKGIADFFTRE